MSTAEMENALGPRYLKVPSASQYLGISEKTLYKYVEERRIPRSKESGRIFSDKHRPTDVDAAMRDQEDLNSILGGALMEGLRQVIREEIQAALSEKAAVDEDSWVKIDEAAEMLQVSPDWLYRNWKKLNFARKLGPKMLRFSTKGIQGYLKTKKFY